MITQARYRARPEGPPTARQDHGPVTAVSAGQVKGNRYSKQLLSCQPPAVATDWERAVPNNDDCIDVLRLSDDVQQAILADLEMASRSAP